MKRIIICSDGTWNRPERLGKDDHPTNVLKVARGIETLAPNNIEQIVFYDWGVGSYYDPIVGGAFGLGLNKNIMDAYRFLVHNYQVGDEIYLFGFSRGAYTVRSLCGMINNCSILKSQHASKIEAAFELYKTKSHKASSNKATQFKQDYAVQMHTKIKFIGVWDTVGSMGLPFSIFNFIGDKDNFYDRKLGSNIEIARHALCLDELREDFEPTLWQERDEVDLKQVWFAGVHSDVGGSYKPDSDGSVLSDIALAWLSQQASDQGLAFTPSFVDSIAPAQLNHNAKQHNEYKGKYRLLGKHVRQIPKSNSGYGVIKVHPSVEQRYLGNYKSKAIEEYKKKFGSWPEIGE